MLHYITEKTKRCRDKLRLNSIPACTVYFASRRERQSKTIVLVIQRSVSTGSTRHMLLGILSLSNLGDIISFLFLLRILAMY